jgi:proline iminopeptidase
MVLSSAIGSQGMVLHSSCSPPGWGFGVAFYEQTYAPLEAHATVIYCDTRGSGGSERDVDPSTINVGQFVHDLDALRAHLGLERFALTGHSHGGYIALNSAVAHPDRLTHLITVDAQIGVTEPGEDMQRTMPLLAAGASDGEFLVCDRGAGHPRLCAAP